MDIGKFLFAWKFSLLESGRPIDAMIDQAVDLGLGMVAIKIADGAATGDGSGSDAAIQSYTQKLHERGIQVWGWHYLYGGRRLVRDENGKVVGSAENGYSTPETEAKVAVQRIKQFGMDGYIIDAEAEYKTAPACRAAQFMSRIKSGLGSVPIALCSYRFPNLHRELAWGEFLEFSDYHMPQVYWGHGDRGDGLTPDGRYLSVIELESSWEQLSKLALRPFLPVGRAYIGDGHAGPRDVEMIAFMDRAKRFGFGGVGFWNWDSLRPGYSGPDSAPRMAAIRNYPWHGQTPPPPEEKVIAELPVYSTMNIRSFPSAANDQNIIGSLPAGTIVKIYEYRIVPPYLWGRHNFNGWSAVHVIGRRYMG